MNLLPKQCKELVRQLNTASNDETDNLLNLAKLDMTGLQLDAKEDVKRDLIITNELANQPDWQVTSETKRNAQDLLQILAGLSHLNFNYYPQLRRSCGGKQERRSWGIVLNFRWDSPTNSG